MHGKNPIRLSELLRARSPLLRQARLANSAYAYRLLRSFAARIERARLGGHVILRSPNADAERYWASLEAVDFNQSLIEEHFTEQEVMDLADTLLYLTGSDQLSLTFRIEEFAEIFLAPLRAALEQADVIIDDDAAGESCPHEQSSSSDLA